MKAQHTCISPYPRESENNELAIRRWIAEKESVCPYAPGAAHYVHLPATLESEREWQGYFADVLQTFYGKRANGKPIERLILLPNANWENHDQACDEAHHMFWRLLSGYYKAEGNAKRAQQSMNRVSKVHAIHPTRGIDNPIVGKLCFKSVARPHKKALFCTAFTPLYASKTFYRYAPCDALVLVNARSLYEKRMKAPKATKSIEQEQFYRALIEATRGQIALDHDTVIHEKDCWEHLLFRVYMNQTPDWKQQPKPALVNILSTLPIAGVNATFAEYLYKLPILKQTILQSHASPAQIMHSVFMKNGLYVKPSYVM